MPAPPPCMRCTACTAAIRYPFISFSPSKIVIFCGLGHAARARRVIAGCPQRRHRKARLPPAALPVQKNDCMQQQPRTQECMLGQCGAAGACWPRHASGCHPLAAPRSCRGPGPASQPPPLPRSCLGSCGTPLYRDYLSQFIMTKPRVRGPPLTSFGPFPKLRVNHDHFSSAVY